VTARRRPEIKDPDLPPPDAPAASPAEAARELCRAARALGFTAVGVAPARLPDEDRARLREWLAAGRQGGMDYLAQDPEARTDVASILPGARSVLVVTLPYAPPREVPPDRARARVATYAQPAADYHAVIAARLEALRLFALALLPGAAARRFCDTTPVLERAYARAAGLAFVGKNTLLIDPRRGSTFFIGGVALDRELPAVDAQGEPLEGPRSGPLASCGTCTRCLEVCPTEAFPAPYVLDAGRCISYLTIEHRGAYDPALRAPVGNHVFGCDLCQAVCPWNVKFAPPADRELAPDPERADPPLVALARRALDGFKGIARSTPFDRPGKRGFLRNVATALGNAGDPAARPLLEDLAAHEDEGVAEHARWALARLASP
jgi:epoxyqueuosine reductase